MSHWGYKRKWVLLGVWVEPRELGTKLSWCVYSDSAVSLHKPPFPTRQQLWCLAFPAQSVSCVQLFATPWIVACQAPLSTGFFRPSILVWVAIFPCRRSFWPRDRTCCPSRQMLDHWATWMCPDPDLPVGALEGASKEGGRSHSSDHIPCCTSSPRWGQCLSTAVANSSSQFFFFF